jgi:hypothetical protein
MKNSLHTRLLLLVIAAAATPPVASALQSQHREFSRTREKELKVVLDVSFGSVTIERGDGENIAEVDYDEEEESKQKLQISYDIENEIGMLRIKLKEPTHFWGSDDSDHDKSRHVTLRLSDAIPVSFDLSLGAGNGQIDLTDLQVKDLKISTGASSVTLKCNKSNSIFADDVTIESGVSKFTATNLGNLNFRNLKFSGGVGSYKLDFGGKAPRHKSNWASDRSAFPSREKFRPDCRMMTIGFRASAWTTTSSRSATACTKRKIMKMLPSG